MNDKPSISRLDVCDKTLLPYRPLMYWQVALQSGRGLRTPGAKKVPNFLLAELYADITALCHSKKRSKGTGKLHRKYKLLIPRRVLEQLVKDARDEFNYQKEINTQAVSWLKPGTVWAIDDTLVLNHSSGYSSYLNNIQDLASSMKLSAFIGPMPDGKAVARNLRKLFDQYGPPLFLKRDNGSNLNSKEVNDILDQYKVIPINSPVATPTYNGAIEKSQREIKQQMRFERFKEQTGLNDHAIQIYAENAIHTLNHKPRERLKGKYPCELFANRYKHKLDKRKRRQAYDEISGLAADILALMTEQKNKDEKRAVNTAFRQAAKKWMLENKYINIKLKNNRREKCYPFFEDEYTINS